MDEEMEAQKDITMENDGRYFFFFFAKECFYSFKPVTKTKERSLAD